MKTRLVVEAEVLACPLCRKPVRPAEGWDAKVVERIAAGLSADTKEYGREPVTAIVCPECSALILLRQRRV